MAQTAENQDSPSWFVKELKDLGPDAREVFEKYSNIPPNDVVDHITDIRNKAFKIYPYPCLGHWGFLDLSIRQSPQYEEILQRVKNGGKYLDVGCCVGQDIRKLVHDGAPSENTYGAELQKAFMDIGYDLFLDKATLQTTFIEADIFNPDSELKQLDGTIDIVHAASFFHLFDWDEQVQAAKRIVKVMKPSPGSLVVGRHIGNVKSGPTDWQFENSKSRFAQNVESWVKMWKQVGDETGTQWKVDAKLEEVEVRGQYIPERTRWLHFTVRRV